MSVENLIKVIAGSMISLSKDVNPKFYTDTTEIAEIHPMVDEQSMLVHKQIESLFERYGVLQLEQEVKDLKARVREFELLLKNQHKLKEENLEMKAFLGGKGFTVDSVDGSLAQLEQEVKELKARNQILSRLKVIGTVALKRVDLPLNKALAQHDREVIQRVKDSILNHELTKYGGSLSDALYVIDEQLQEQGNNE